MFVHYGSSYPVGQRLSVEVSSTGKYISPNYIVRNWEMLTETHRLKAHMIISQTLARTPFSRFLYTPHCSSRAKMTLYLDININYIISNISWNIWLFCFSWTMITWISVHMYLWSKFEETLLCVLIMSFQCPPFWRGSKSFQVWRLTYL